MRVESVERGAADIVRVRTDGGSRFIFRLTYLDSNFSLIPEPGEEVGEDFLAAVSAAAETHAAEMKAQELLSRAEHTRYLLALKLRKRGIPDAVFVPALDYLEGRKLLSDERYANSWVEERIRRRGDGPARMVAGLAARGVRDDLARRVVRDLLTEPVRREALLRSLRRTLRSGRNDEEKTLAKLRAEGWRPCELSDALESFRKGSE